MERMEEPTLSEEAKSLLLEAAGGDGTIMRFDDSEGLTIRTNGKSFLPDQTPRTRARWDRY